jgi:protein dithiol oxidoreductase (disulfide-forming)
MKRLLALTLALMLTACGQSDQPAATAGQAASAEPATTAATRAAESAQAPTQAVPAATTTTTAAPDTGGAVSFTLAKADLSDVEAAGYVEGKNFLRLSPAQPTSTGNGQIEVDEFFMYICPHCYNLEPYVESWLEHKPAYVNFVRVPTTWDAQKKLHAQAFYAEKALGKVDQMHMPFFQEIHVNGNLLDTPAKIAEFFGRYGVSKQEFDSVFDSFAVNLNVNQATERGTRYRIDSTPSFVVNGTYRTDVSMAGGTPDELFKLLELLAASELKH